MTTPPTPSTPATPPLTAALREQARACPGQWLYAIDPAFDPNGSVPPYGVIGAWQVDHQGAITGFQHNPDYRPSPQALELPAPRNAAEAALQNAATGHGGEAELLAALLETPLLLRADRSGPQVVAGEGGRQVLQACTSPAYLPTGWAGSITVTGRELGAAVTGLDLCLNPGSRLSVTLPVDDLAAADEA
ncbi:type VII secretion system-associated protein [Kitasatospora sp. LaBMicrA B282]|uniref:type VII secretion system-associated protein n=1 Tax=Kitasatospora sp. LaBMicrA B282 TaxID=3420949 RepID=UPI003D112BBD